jgi:CRP-like cAMP-binding protein
MILQESIVHRRDEEAQLTSHIMSIRAPSPDDERRTSDRDWPAIITTQVSAEEALAEPFARLNLAATELPSGSPPTHQAEAATSAPPPQRHDDDWPSSSSSSSSSSQNHQQDEEGFETILKQMFPDRPSGVIRELLGTNPTREKALEVANYLADERPPTGNDEAQPPPSTPTPAPAPTPAPINGSVQSHFLWLIRSMTSNKPLNARDVRDGDKIAFNDAKNQIRLIRKLADEGLRAKTVAVSDNMKADKEEDDSGDANFVARDEGAREALYDKQDLSKFDRVKIHHKTPDVHSLIYNVIKPNALFEDLTNEEVMQIIDVFKPGAFKEGKVIVRQGDKGSEFYVVESGELIEHDEGGVSKARIYARGDAFGELVFGLPSVATITATTDVRVWILERNVYSSVINSIRREQYQEKYNFFRDCVVDKRPFSEIFDFYQIQDLAIAAKVDNFEEGEVILREGEIVDTFYIVRSGRIVRYKTNSEGNWDKVGTIDERKVFGTTSLLKGGGSPYTYRASTRVKVFYLTRQDFESIMGSVKDAFDNNTSMSSVAKSTRREDASRNTIVTSSSLRPIYKCDLDDLTFYNVLGHGAFGYVMLVQSKKTKRLFALKAQPKYKIVMKKVQDRILNEFVIGTQVEHKNLLRIHCAMQDERYLYFLLDLLPGEYCSWVGLFPPRHLKKAVYILQVVTNTLSIDLLHQSTQGGMLMDYLLKITKLSSGRAFDEEVTKFYAASVVLAFEHLHNLMIAYRDLKPVRQISFLLIFLFFTV